ncbi:MAG: 4Fe-4S binding protein, partial [Anaerolineae bacterium]|nr:4Fe-4S binding protein [Anaerolineae bacterium]
MAGNYQTSVLGPIKSHKEGFQRLFSHQGLRRLAQIGVAVYILYLVVLHSLVGENGPTAVASAEAFCPFGGLETLYKYITGNGSFVSHTHLSNLVLLAAVLIAALLLRSAFCGWICPLGFLQDLMALLSRFMQRRLPVLRRAMTTLKKKGAWLAVADRYLRWLKYAVLAWAVGGSAYFGMMVFREFDPWAALLNIAELSF